VFVSEDDESSVEDVGIDEAVEDVDNVLWWDEFL
jgi:hypothetical protein